VELTDPPRSLWPRNTGPCSQVGGGCSRRRRPRGKIVRVSKVREYSYNKCQVFAMFSGKKKKVRGKIY
jgi:hypothetical protein